MTRQIILDTETTGLSTKDGHRIIEIGCVELINRKFTGNNFHYYLNPNREIDAQAIKVHGLTNQFLAKKPIFSDVVAELLKYIANAELIAHNAKFDVNFLDYELSMVSELLGKTAVISDYAAVTDTLELAKKIHPGQKNSLDALCKRYNVDNTDRELHGALLDANLLAQVYLAMTGGQTMLDCFNAEVLTKPEQKHAHDNQGTLLINNKAEVSNNDVRVITANDAELLEHNRFLDKIRKSAKSGCLWDNAEII